MNLDIIKAFLKLFWDPGVFLFPEWNWTKQNHKYWWLESSLEINQKSWNAVWFAPNWNLGKKNNAGDKIKREVSDCEDYISCLFLDLDKRHTEYEEKTPKEYEKYVLSVINQHRLRVQYAVKTWDWWHLYMFIRPECRYECWRLFKNSFKLIEESLAEMFIGWDKSSHSLNKLLRLPWSKYWKTPIPKDVELYRMVDNEDGYRVFKKVETADEVDLKLYDVFLTNTVWLQDFVDNQKEVPIKNKSKKNIVYSAMTAQINQLDITEVINRLEKYPRTDDNWVNTVFKTSWDCIYLVRNWVRIDTDWYKINKKENYVHNFSFDAHPITERPRWFVYPFLYFYFNWDMIKMWDFLNKEFNIDFTDLGNQTFMKIPADKWVILFQDTWVYYHKTVNKDWQTTDITIKLFNEPFIIKWILRTQFDKLWEMDNKITYTIISLINNEEEWDILITYQEDRKKFNKVYGKINWLKFLQWEFDLIDFYDAIESAARTKAIREFDHIYLNWYYQDKYVLWNKVLAPNWEVKDMENEPVVINTQDIITIPIKTNTTVWAYWEKLRTVFSDREAMLAFVTFITLLMWDKFRKPLLNWDWQQIIVPGLFMSGITKSGKSTMVNLLMNWFGLSWDCRKYSVKWTTPQPLKQAATDDFVLHREEFTWEIWNEKETIVRDVLNKSKTSRWLMDWSNANYIYRSSLIIDWEQLPESESVTNRCVTIPFMLEDRIGTQQLLREFNWLGYQKDFIEKLYNIDKSKVMSEFTKAQDRCINNWIADRYSMMYALLLCVNDWFNIYIEDELLAAVKENFEQFTTVNATLTPLAKLLSDIITKQKQKVTYTQYDEWWRRVIVPIPTADFAKRQADIMGIIKRYWKKRITIRWANMLITLAPEDKDNPLTQELYNYIIMYGASMTKVNYLWFEWWWDV